MAALSKRKQFLFWIVAALVATAGLTVVLISEDRLTATRNATYVIGIPEKGAALFFGEKHCSICHSVNGTGGRVAPDLSGRRPGTPAMGWLATVLWNHAPGMWRQMRSVKSPQLNQEEMAHILAFLYQVATDDRPGDASAGQRVFSAKGCGHCHAVGSSGGKLGPELTSPAASGDGVAWVHAMWNHAQSMIDPITKELGQWPQFTGKEMNDLIAYVNGGGPAKRPAGADQKALRGSAERGWQVFQAKCIQCHSVRGQGGHVGPELGPDHGDLPQSTAQFAAVLWNHAPAMLRQVREAGMTAPTLKNDEITDVLRFLTSLRYFEPAGSPFLGERVFAERGCAQCHGPKADGTREGPRLGSGGTTLTTVSLTAALWSHGPAMRARAEHLGIPWPSLEATDMGDLISFLNDPARKK